MKIDSIVSTIITVIAVVVLGYLNGFEETLYLFAILISGMLPIILAWSIYSLVNRNGREVTWTLFKSRIIYYIGIVLVTAFLFIWILDDYFRAYVLITDAVVLGGMLIFFFFKKIIKAR